MRQDELKELKKKLVGTRTDKGGIRLNSAGDNTYQGHPGTD